MEISNLVHPLKIKKKVRETADSVSLILEIPPELKAKFKYQPGQFITLLLNISGQELKRSYSISSSPFADVEFRISVKGVAGGRASTYLLEESQVGDVLLCTPPAGNFYKDPGDARGRHYILFGAGSGVTPLLSILKTALTTNINNRVTLVDCNRSEADIMFKKELETLRAQYADRFHLEFVLSRPSPDWTGLQGRLCPEHFSKKLSPVIQKKEAQSEAYLCGPTDFMKLAENLLLSEGLRKEQIRRESFDSGPAPKPEASGSWVYIGSIEPEEKPESLRVILSGETQDLPYDGSMPILEYLMEKGLNPPYSCLDGACMACMAKVTEGQVKQKEMYILTEDNLAARETITCQAIGCSKKITINYDAI